MKMKREVKHISLILSVALCLNACTDFVEGDSIGGVVVSETELSFSAGEDTRSLSVQSGEKWTVSTLPEWLSVKSISSRGSNNWTLNLASESNPGYDRKAVMALSSKSKIVSISVAQAGAKGQYVPVESVELSHETLLLKEEDTFKLSATILPANASDQTVSWQSSNNYIATVSSDGLVEAKTVGSAVITATAKDGGRMASCSVEVTYKVPIEGTENGHDWVDLGLPSGKKWATCNVGASLPEEYGDYFAWGEVAPKSIYSWTTYAYCITVKYSPVVFLKYNTDSKYGDTDGKTKLDLSDDAVRVNWGGTWRTPTVEELRELANYCSWTWTSVNGVNGYLVKSWKYPTSIFLPAGGYMNGSSPTGAGGTGQYQSSELFLPESAYPFYFDSTFHGFRSGIYILRCPGQLVRGVMGDLDIEVTSITLDKTSLEMTEGEYVSVKSTVYPENATHKTVEWSSSNTSVATVEKGKVHAIKAGSARITAKSGNVSKTCSVTVKPGNHEYVDLGLSVKWAACNIGASKPEDYGDYFAWGEVFTKTDYSSYTYKYGRYNSELWKYVTDKQYGAVDNKTTLELSDDAARANWSGDWRMPTEEELDELLSECTWTRTTLNGVNVCKVTSKKNGNSIFLPAAGVCSDSSLNNAGTSGCYWTSSLYTSFQPYANYLYFSSSNEGSGSGYRYYGCSVRAVKQ